MPLKKEGDWEEEGSLSVSEGAVPKGKFFLREKKRAPIHPRAEEEKNNPSSGKKEDRSWRLFEKGRTWGGRRGKKTMIRGGEPKKRAQRLQ